VEREHNLHKEKEETTGRQQGYCTKKDRKKEQLEEDS
jgi:hypothetical protein